MPGLVPGIHVLFDRRDRGWPGSQTSLRSLRKQTTMPGHDERKGNEETRMPEITVSMAAGRTDEQKAGMMRDITQALVKNLGVDADAVVIQINEAPLTHKMKGGKTFVERAAAEKKQRGANAASARLIASSFRCAQSANPESRDSGFA